MLFLIILIRKIKAVVDAKLNFEHQIELVETNLKFYLVQHVKQRFTATFTAKRRSHLCPTN